VIPSGQARERAFLIANIVGEDEANENALEIRSVPDRGAEHGAMLNL
jgi:hypothetical protein